MINNRRSNDDVNDERTPSIDGEDGMKEGCTVQYSEEEVRKTLGEVKRHETYNRRRGGKKKTEKQKNERQDSRIT